MGHLYVTEQGAMLRKRGERVRLEKKGEVLLDLPCRKLDGVSIFGNVQFSTQAAAELLEHGIELALFTRSGRLRGQLTPPHAKNVELRRAQYERSQDAGFCLEVAREIVAAKIESSAARLAAFRSDHPEALSAAEPAALRALAARLPAATSLEALRGLEGSAAARYFGCFGALVPEELGFDGRSRRPPRDPVNALLSFGYVIVGNELQSLLDGIGFDPYLGFYHQVDYGRPSLALDLLEEFRVGLVDRLAAKLFNTRVLGRDDFTGDPRRGFFLRREGKKQFFTAYERELSDGLVVDGRPTGFRDLYRRQAHRLARALTAGEPYESFRLPC